MAALVSTCRGSLPPHDNCQAGDRCDWEGRPGRAEAIARAAADLDAMLLAVATGPYGPKPYPPDWDRGPSHTRGAARLKGKRKRRR